MKESSMKNKIRITERGEGGREMFEDEEIQRIDKQKERQREILDRVRDNIVLQGEEANTQDYRKENIGEIEK